MDTKGLIAAIFFGIVVTMIPFASKTILNVYKFEYPFFVLGAKSLFGAVAVESLRLLGLVSVAPYSFKRATNRQLLLVSICGVVHNLLVGAALKGMNIPMFGALRQTTPFVSLVLLVVVLKKPLPSFLVTFSVLLITAGCVVAGIGDLSFNAVSYTAALLSVVAIALQQTVVQKATAEGFSVADTFQVTSYNSVFMAAFAAFVTGEWQTVQHFKQLTDPDFLFAFTVLLVVANLLIYTQDLCTSLNGALTTSLVGVIKNIPQTFLGYISFGGVQYHPLNVLGLGLNMVGAFLFTYGKYVETSSTHWKKS